MRLVKGPIALILLLLISAWQVSLVNAADVEKNNEINKQKTAVAIFAGGCFWCVEALYQEQPGVLDVVSGFTGGKLRNPKYSGNHKGHWEAVQVTYDPSKISYQKLLDLYWVNIDPFDDRGQFCDKGPSYRSAIFYLDDTQKSLAEASLSKTQAEFSTEIVTEIRAATRFWPVEEYHQDYYKKNPIRYRFYRSGCRRDNRLEQIWGDRAGGGKH